MAYPTLSLISKKYKVFWGHIFLIPVVIVSLVNIRLIERKVCTVSIAISQVCLIDEVYIISNRPSLCRLYYNWI